jgi:Ca2+/H+ antiporter, TMEM165/GDT1 family
LEPFVVSTAVVALGEIGDMTQIATVAPAARFDAIVAIVLGTTLGVLTLLDVGQVFG